MRSKAFPLSSKIEPHQQEKHDKVKNSAKYLKQNFILDNPTEKCLASKKIKSASERSTLEVLNLLEKCEETYKQYLAWKHPQRIERPSRIFTLKASIQTFEFNGVQTSSSYSQLETFLIDVGYLTNQSFPQSYKITISKVNDIDWNYTHLCTPFSFRSIIAHQSLNLKNALGFQKFGTLLIDLIRSVHEDPSSYSAQLRVYKNEGLTQLVFLESISGLRTSPILILDLKPTKWEDLKPIVLKYHQFLQNSLTQANRGLCTLLQVIQQYAPALLLHVSRTSASFHTSNQWMDQLQTSLFQTTKPRFMTQLLASQKPIVQPKPRASPEQQDLFSRKLLLQCGNEPKPLVLSISSLKHNEELCFQLSLSDPNDPLFYMRSSPFNRNAWYTMLDNNYDLDPGFLPEEGVGGVVGLLRRYIELCGTKRKLTAELQPLNPAEAQLTFTEHFKYGRSQVVLQFFMMEVEDPSGWARKLSELVSLEKEQVQQFQMYWEVIKKYKPSLLLHVPVLPTQAPHLFSPSSSPWIESNRAFLWPEHILNRPMGSS